MILVLGSDFLMKVPRSKQQGCIRVNIGRGINLDGRTRDVAALLGWCVVDGEINEACQPKVVNQRAGLRGRSECYNLAWTIGDLLKQGNLARRNRTFEGIPINR